MGSNSASDSLNLTSLSTFDPRTTFFPNNYSGSGGLGIRASNELNKWSNTWTILASPIEQLSKYSIPYFLAKLTASILVTGLTTYAFYFLFGPPWIRSILFPTRILIGISQARSHSDIH